MTAAARGRHCVCDLLRVCDRGASNEPCYAIILETALAVVKLCSLQIKLALLLLLVYTLRHTDH